MTRKRSTLNSVKYLERRIKRNARQLALRNTPYVSEAYKQYQNYQNLSAIKRDGLRYIKYKITRAKRRFKPYI